MVLYIVATRYYSTNDRYWVALPWGKVYRADVLGCKDPVVKIYFATNSIFFLANIARISNASKCRNSLWAEVVILSDLISQVESIKIIVIALIDCWWNLFCFSVCAYPCLQKIIYSYVFVSSVRSSYSHPDLLLTHPPHPTFSDHTGPQHWTFTFWATTAI